MMNTVLVTDHLRATPRLITALAHAGALKSRGSLTVGAFGRGERPAAALLSRLGIPVVDLTATFAATTERALAGFALAARAHKIVMWDCPRAAMAIHPLVARTSGVEVEYLMPWMDSSTWGESGVIARRTANLITTFVVEDPRVERLLAAIGVPGRVLRPDLGDETVGPRSAAARRTLVVATGAGAAVQADEPVHSGLGPVVKCGPVAAGAIALGLAPRTGILVLPDPSPESLGPALLAAGRGWQVMVPPRVAERAPDRLSTMSSSADRSMSHVWLRSTSES